MSLHLPGAMRHRRPSVLHIKHEFFLTCLNLTCPVYCNSMKVIPIFSLLFLVTFVGAAPFENAKREVDLDGSEGGDGTRWVRHLMIARREVDLDVSEGGDGTRWVRSLKARKHNAGIQM
ncbi:hypothetical protein K443DRAFT_362919 [Laccaria amethystina LaAM-08-1]|uniref:Uncharacterized protein n=1 Tax=Laccaria amethystina LaAM-08-1 TaxID=1095629 RepID=A0A0C9WZH4_9AGAR|nr:hypothetical protein K443DRAFT_362919 [Laccaria amethystina LaAM-08-1]